MQKVMKTNIEDEADEGKDERNKKLYKGKSFPKQMVSSTILNIWCSNNQQNFNFWNFPNELWETSLNIWWMDVVDVAQNIKPV